MSEQKQPDGAIEAIRTQSGLRVFGWPVVDTLGNKALVHESSVPESEGGPFVWLTLQKAGETEGVGVLLDSTQLEELQELLASAQEGLGG